MSMQESLRNRKLFRAGSGLDDFWDIAICMKENHIPYGYYAGIMLDAFSYPHFHKYE